MESADPRLISAKDLKSYNSFRLGGSRSDLFAITLIRTLRNLCSVPFLSSNWLIHAYVPALNSLTHKPFLVRPLMGQ